MIKRLFFCSFMLFAFSVSAANGGNGGDGGNGADGGNGSSGDSADNTPGRPGCPEELLLIKQGNFIFQEPTSYVTQVSRTHYARGNAL